MKTIVVSAVNLRKGGTLTILRQCLEAMSGMVHEKGYRVVALVHRQTLADYPGIEYIELPWAVKSWLLRLWCEYVSMWGISKRIGDIDLWLSLHDTTPRVRTRRQATYCHNAYPFFRWSWRHLLQNYRIVCFSLFSRWIYRINIHRNDCVIVQQQWLRDAFVRLFGLSERKIIVAPPMQISNPKGIKLAADDRRQERKRYFTFIYPAYPDVHKNHECLCEATRMLESEVGTERFRVILTTTPRLNRYSRWLQRHWGSVRSLTFAGFMPREELLRVYGEADCLVFPSQVETWGLPISEFGAMGKPMLLADRPYAHETATGCQRVAYFDADRPVRLKELMHDVMEGRDACLQKIPATKPAPPVAYGWEEILEVSSFGELRGALGS